MKKMHFFHASPANIKVGDALKLTNRKGRNYCCVTSTKEHAHFWADVLSGIDGDPSNYYIYQVAVDADEVVTFANEGKYFSLAGGKKMTAEEASKLDPARINYVDVDSEIIIFGDAVVVDRTPFERKNLDFIRKVEKKKEENTFFEGAIDAFKENLKTLDRKMPERWLHSRVERYVYPGIPGLLEKVLNSREFEELVQKYKK